MRTQKIEISHRTIVFTVLFVIFIWLLYFIRDILLQLYVALIIMIVLNPLVTRLNKKLKIPRALSVFIVYVGVIALFIVSIGGTVTPLVDQTTRFANQLPSYMEDLNIPVEIVDQITAEITSQIGQLPAQVLSIGVSILSNIVNVLAVLIIALYLLISREKFDDHLENFLSKSQVSKFESILNDLESTLGSWARGQVILMIIVGIATYIGLTVLGVPFALSLAVLAGLLEFVPNVGPTLSAIPAVIVGLSVSPVTGLAVIALYVLIQQLEAYLLVPQVMRRSVGLNPVVVLVALIIGFKLAGIVGALLAVPVVLTLRVFLSHFLLQKNNPSAHS